MSCLESLTSICICRVNNFILKNRKEFFDGYLCFSVELKYFSTQTQWLRYEKVRIQVGRWWGSSFSSINIEPLQILVSSKRTKHKSCSNLFVIIMSFHTYLDDIVNILIMLWRLTNEDTDAIFVRLIYLSVIPGREMSQQYGFVPHPLCVLYNLYFQQPSNEISKSPWLTIA